MESAFQFGHGHPDAAPVLVILLIIFGTLIALIALAVRVLIFCKIFQKQLRKLKQQ